VYDLVGKVQSVNDPTGTYGFAYDNMGRLTGTTTSYGFLTSRSFTTTYAYDAASNPNGFTARDADDAPERVGPSATAQNVYTNKGLNFPPQYASLDCDFRRTFRGTMNHMRSQRWKAAPASRQLEEEHIEADSNRQSVRVERGLSD
jgi:YD repeat-containing protein